MTDLKPMRKPAILAIIAAFTIGMAMLPGDDAGQVAGLGALAFFLYLLLGD